MTDRELLELAAKAAGLDAYWDDEYQRMQMDFIHKGGTNYEEWNPLTDDGDALRLAVKLKILVDVTSFATTAIANGDIHAAEKHKHAAEKHNGDPYDATRRAIVRAAAAIGEGMK